MIHIFFPFIVVRKILLVIIVIEDLIYGRVGVFFLKLAGFPTFSEEAADVI